MSNSFSTSGPRGSDQNAPKLNQKLLDNLERLNRTLRALSAGNHTLLHAVDEQALLHDMCEVIVGTGRYHVAAVGYAQHDRLVGDLATGVLLHFAYAIVMPLTLG